ncbi:17683_t:CDS:2 [Funneliformis geosporum]|uniref:17683_t:CDS:1 n=1 Tax=Funneliformis geosporum TaxID=1117311 RepID=A0A9W4WRI5_9GLOM|nr:17683_t:CDS:2 [Funneliformis geosporum]
MDLSLFLTEIHPKDMDFDIKKLCEYISMLSMLSDFGPCKRKNKLDFSGKKLDIPALLFY